MSSDPTWHAESCEEGYVVQTRGIRASGLDVERLGERPPTTEPGTRALLAPRFLDIHRSA